MPSWNPNNYKTYWLDWEDDNGGWWEDNFVMARDYEDLLELYKDAIYALEQHRKSDDETWKHRERLQKLLPAGYLGWHFAEAAADYIERIQNDLISARVLPFRDGYWVFTEKFSFFTKPHKEEKKPQPTGHIGPRPAGYKGNWR